MIPDSLLGGLGFILAAAFFVMLAGAILGVLGEMAYTAWRERARR